MVDLKLKIDDSFFLEEERCGHLVTKEMKQLWAVELDLLAELDRVCKKHNIKYFTDSGTTLGAARHSGFIPWDDDIDVGMFREEYEKFCRIAPEEFRHPYFFQTEYTDPGSLRGHAQIRNSETTAILKYDFRYKYKYNQGVFIDIFPLDYLPNDPAQHRGYADQVNERMLKAMKYGTMVNRFNTTHGKLKTMATRLSHAAHFAVRNKPNKYFREFEDFLISNDQTPTDYIGEIILYPVPFNQIWKTEWYADTVIMPFEMLEVPVPSGYDELLTAMFGDWRTPVKQSTWHGNLIFDADKPYTEYLFPKRRKRA